MPTRTNMSTQRRELEQAVRRWADSYYAFCTGHTTDAADRTAGDVAQVAKILVEHEAMRGWLMSADHQSGCSGDVSPAYRCKCGLRDLLAELELEEVSE